MDNYSLFFIIAISIIVVSSVSLNILFSLKLKKLTEAITQSNSDMSLKISNDIMENSNKMVNQLNNEFALLTEFSEFIRNNLKLYSDTVIINLSDLYKSSEHSLRIHENVLKEISLTLKSELSNLRNVTTNSINDTNKTVNRSLEELQKSLSIYQTEIGNILKNGLNNIDKSLRETIDVN